MERAKDLRPGRARRARREAPEQLDLLQHGDELDTGFADPLPFEAIVAAHAANEGSPKRGELVPSF